MGRPKKLLFSCTYCDKTFKRRPFLEKHLLSHRNTSGQSRRARIRSNWCHVCRKSFAKSEYKLHFMIEHQYDSYGISFHDDSENEIDDLEKNKKLFINLGRNGNVCNSKKEYSPNKNIKQEIDKTTTTKSSRKKIMKFSKMHQADSASSLIKIKSEPLDEHIDNHKSKISPKRRKMDAKSSFIICSKCGLKCKGKRGLKIHLSTTHKRNYSNTNKHENSSKEVKNQVSVQSKQVQPNEASDQSKNFINSSMNNQPLIMHNTALNLNQNAQTGLMCNMFPMQNQPFIGIGNQPNVQLLPILLNQNTPVETVPKFDHDSENYIKWLKKFINRCKMHKYPLTPMLCQSISHINEEITDALANPAGSMKKRSNHFYFMKIKSLLSEIMLGHLRYSLDVVKR